MEHATYGEAIEYGTPSAASLGLKVGNVHAMAVLMQQWALAVEQNSLNLTEWVIFFSDKEGERGSRIFNYTAVHRNDVMEYLHTTPFLVHGDVKVYRLWDGYEPYYCQFTTDESEVLDGFGFDIRNLESPVTRLDETGDENHYRQVLREAIDAGEITEDGKNPGWGDLDGPSEDGDEDDED